MNSLKETFQQQGYLTRDQLKKYAKDNGISYNLVKKVLFDLGIKIYDIKPQDKVKSTSGEYENLNYILRDYNYELRETKEKLDQIYMKLK